MQPHIVLWGIAWNRLAEVVIHGAGATQYECPWYTCYSGTGRKRSAKHVALSDMLQAITGASRIDRLHFVL
jgi:hypothetical protein